MALTEESFKEMRENQLSPESTFQFECAMCGKCCRSREEQILVTGPDIFRIACALNISIYDAMDTYTRGYIGDSSHIPVAVLRERLDGSCRLLYKGRCSTRELEEANRNRIRLPIY